MQITLLSKLKSDFNNLYSNLIINPYIAVESLFQQLVNINKTKATVIIKTFILDWIPIDNKW